MYLKLSKNTGKLIYIGFVPESPTYLTLKCTFLNQRNYSKNFISKNDFQLNKNQNCKMFLFKLNQSFQKLLKLHENFRNCYFRFFQQQDKALNYILEFFVVKNFLNIEKRLQNYTKLVYFNFEKQLNKKHRFNYTQINFSRFKEKILETNFNQKFISFTLKFFSNSLFSNLKDLSKNIKKKTLKNFFIDSYLFEYLSLYNSTIKYSFLGFLFLHNSLKSLNHQFKTFKQDFFVYFFLNLVAKMSNSKNLVDFDQNLELIKTNPLNHFFYTYLLKNFLRNCFDFSFYNLRNSSSVSFDFQPFFSNFLLKHQTAFFIKKTLKSTFKIPLENFRETFYYLKKLNFMIDLNFFFENSTKLSFKNEEKLLFLQKDFFILKTFEAHFVNFLNLNSTLKRTSVILLTRVLNSALKILKNLKLNKFQEPLTVLTNQTFQRTSSVMHLSFHLLQKLRLLGLFSFKCGTLIFQKQFNFKNFHTGFLKNKVLFHINFKNIQIFKCPQENIFKNFFQIFKQFQFKCHTVRNDESFLPFFNKAFFNQVKYKKPLLIFIFSIQYLLCCIKSIYFSKNLEKKLNQFFEYILINYYLRISFLKTKKSFRFLEMIDKPNNSLFLIKTNKFNAFSIFLKYKKFKSETSDFFYKTALINLKKLQAYIFNYFENSSISRNLLLYIKELKNLIKKFSTETQINLIRKLNLKIYSICYYSNLLNLSGFSIFLDQKLFQLLWRWAVRRHPNKSKKWIKSKYFHKFGRQNWIFGTFLDENLEFSKFYPGNFMYLPFHFQIEKHFKKTIK